jgi:hypothetical protein
VLAERDRAGGPLPRRSTGRSGGEYDRCWVRRGVGGHWRVQIPFVLYEPRSILLIVLPSSLACLENIYLLIGDSPVNNYYCMIHVFYYSFFQKESLLRK